MKNKVIYFFHIAEMHPILSKDERNMKNKVIYFFHIAEMHPILSKDSENRAQYEKIKPFIFFILPRCILSYLKIVKIERNMKNKAIYFFHIAEMHPILSKYYR